MKRFKLLLLNPPFTLYGGIRDFGGTMMPLNLCSLAAYVRQQNEDIEIKILDSERMGLNHDEIIDEIKHFCPDLIGITSNTCVFDMVKRLTASIKKKVGRVPVILGGSHVSALPEQSLVESNADFVVIGEGEAPLNEVVNKLKRGRCDWDNINGLAYFSNGRPNVNPPVCPIQNLDLLPFPARDLIDNESYSAAPTKRVSLDAITLISTSRGCPYDCGFCAQQAIWGRKNRMRSSESVVAEIEECINKYNISSFNFTDELFTSNLKRVIAISILICDRKLNIRWVCSARPEKLDLETFKTMYAAGCREISFGVESGNQKILESINKNTNLEEISGVINLAKKSGITTHASYILGYLGEDESTIKDTIKFAKKLNTHIAAFFIASPLPGSRLYKEASSKGYLKLGSSWINYSPFSNQQGVLDLPNLSSEKIRMWHRKAIKDYYLRPKYIISRLLSIRHLYDIANLFAGIKLLFGIKR
jgi:anaerobic magnesium-protoporphyrin IX monomethyl ester cyclase